MSRSQCPRAVAVSPLRCLTIIMIVIAVLCLLSLPMSVSASALADDASGSSNSLLHTFKVAREARLKNQPGPIDININININNNNNNDGEDEVEQHTNDNNQNTAIVFPAETSNAMWEFQTTPRPPQPTTGQAEEQLSSLMAQNDNVDSRRTPFQDLIQQLQA